MKFKIGDPVLAIDNIGKFKDWTAGVVTEVPPTSRNYRVRFPYGGNLYVKDSNSIKPIPSDAAPKIVITADGKTTLARLYEGDKVIRSAEAKCSPADTFSFQTGAELAFKRLFETAKPGPTNKYEAMSDEELKDAACDRAGLCTSVNGKRFHECPLFSKHTFGACTRYLRDNPELRPVLIQYCLDEDAAQKKSEPPKADKPKYSKGDKVKILRDRTECGYYHAFAKGEIVKFEQGESDTRASLYGKSTLGDHSIWNYVKYEDFEPYTEPKEEPKFSWEEFKSGKIAVHCDTEEKAKEFVAEAMEKFPDKFVKWEKGETNWSVYKEETRYGISDLFCYGTWGFDGYTIIDYPFSPAPEPKPEPVKLYCVKDLGDCLTNGKVYESVNGHVVVDDGCEYVDIIMRTRGYLYPLVKRPAIDGEWVYINNATWTTDLYKNGDVFQAENTFPDGDFINQKEGGVFGAEYLVIDGYQPEEKKPEYYNGKVVCVDDGGIRMKGAWTVGKVYTFKDGFAYQDNGVIVPYFESPITSVDDLNAKCAVRSSIRFVEYKGEA